MRGTLNGQRWARIMRDTPRDGGGNGGGGSQRQGSGNNSGGGNGNDGGHGDRGNGDGNDDDFFDDVDDGDGDGGQGDGNGGGGQGGFTEQQLQQIVQAVTPAFQSEMDRRINQVVKGRRSGARNGRNDQRDGGNGRQNDDQQDRRQDQQRQDEAARREQVFLEQDRREARSAFREYMGDKLKFVSQVEREHAVRLGQQVLSGYTEIDDPDAVGREVAAEVTDAVVALRNHYKDLTIKTLKKKGWTAPAGNGGSGDAPSFGGSTGGPAPAVKGSTSQVSGKFQRVAALAAEYNQAQGYQPASQQNGN